MKSFLLLAETCIFLLFVKIIWTLWNTNDSKITLRRYLSLVHVHVKGSFHSNTGTRRFTSSTLWFQRRILKKFKSLQTDGGTERQRDGHTEG